jgi:hypothetical protein
VANFNEGGVKWTRYEALESSRAGVSLEEAKSAAKSEVAERQHTKSNK